MTPEFSVSSLKNKGAQETLPVVVEAYFDFIPYKHYSYFNFVYKI